MKTLPTILTVTVIGLAVFVVFSYMSAMNPVWVETKRQESAIEIQQYKMNAQTDIQAHAERAQLLTGLLQGTGSAIVLFLFGYGAVYVWAHYDKRRESWARPVDGQYALQQFSNGAVTWQVDINKSLTGNAGFQKATGLLGEFSSNYAGPDRQLEYAKSVQTTRTASAVTSGDGFKYAATGKFLAGGYDKTSRLQLPADEEEQEEVQGTWQPLTFQDAFAQSNKTEWILGQNKSNGELFTLNLQNSSHLGVIGSTGSGKTTYFALALMAYALKAKYRVIIGDGKGGADWSKYSDFVEYYTLNAQNISGFVAEITKEYNRRQTILNQNQVNSIWRLPNGVKLPLPTIIIIDEFGACMASLKAFDKAAYAKVETELGNLLSLARGAGIYMVFCDQNPTRWGQTMIANLPMNVCFRTGGKIGYCVNQYHLDSLERTGQFMVGDDVYQAFQTYTVIDEILQGIEYRKPKALLTVKNVAEAVNNSLDNETVANGLASDGVYKPVVDPIQTQTVSGGFKTVANGFTQENETVSAVLFGPAKTNSERQTVLSVYQKTGSKTATCKKVWGRKDGVTWKWLHEILPSEVKQ